MNGYPRLYIGRAAQEFKKRMNLRIIQLTKETMPDFLDYYTNIPKMETPLVIEDLAYLPIYVQSELLKFIEESQIKIILFTTIS